MIFSKIIRELSIYIMYLSILEEAFIIWGRIAGSLVKLKGNYIYIYIYISIMYLSILKEAFIIWGDSCSNVLHKINIVCFFLSPIYTISS